MNRTHAPRQLQTQHRSPPGGGQAVATLTGPRHASLNTLASMLDHAPATRRLSAMQPVQRVIFGAPVAGGGGNFDSQGRAGPHNTAGNRDSLAELRDHRHQNPDPAQHHVNNEHENNVVANHHNSTRGTGLHMAHHVSDSVVQGAVVQAANGHNLGAPAPWGHVQAMVQGIDPGAMPAPMIAAMPVFHAHATAVHQAAVQSLNALMAPNPIPYNAASEAQLTALANAIANSPMNLHHGAGQANMSLGSHNDPNNHAMPGLARARSWRTEQMHSALVASGFNPQQYDRTHADAMAMNGTVAHQHAMQAPAAPAHSIHNSASGFF